MSKDVHKASVNAGFFVSVAYRSPRKSMFNLSWGGIVDIGKILIIVGGLILLAGLSLSFAPWLFNWFGKLPGDIHIKNEHSTVFIPITSMIVISLILTLIVNLFFRK